MKKIIKELKWLLVSALIVVSAIGLVIGVANFCQWKVELNVASYEAGQVEWVRR